MKKVHELLQCLCEHGMFFCCFFFKGNMSVKEDVGHRLEVIGTAVPCGLPFLLFSAWSAEDSGQGTQCQFLWS